MKNITYKTVQWSTPEELHEECIVWLSQLEFIKEEQRFLNALVTDYTIPLISNKFQHKSLIVVGNLDKEEKKLQGLTTQVHDHFNKIETLLEFHIDSREKEAYKETHYHLKITMNKYTSDYQEAKSALFNEIKELMKKEPAKRLSK